MTDEAPIDEAHKLMLRLRDLQRKRGAGPEDALWILACELRGEEAVLCKQIVEENYVKSGKLKTERGRTIFELSGQVFARRVYQWLDRSQQKPDPDARDRYRNGGGGPTPIAETGD